MAPAENCKYLFCFLLPELGALRGIRCAGPEGLEPGPGACQADPGGGWGTLASQDLVCCWMSVSSLDKATLGESSPSRRVSVLAGCKSIAHEATNTQSTVILAGRRGLQRDPLLRRSQGREGQGRPYTQQAWKPPPLKIKGPLQNPAVWDEHQGAPAAIIESRQCPHQVPHLWEEASKDREKHCGTWSWVFPPPEGITHGPMSLTEIGPRLTTRL